MKIQFTILFLLFTLLASAQDNLKNSLAIQGYDPVAYFTKSKAVKGSASYKIKYKGGIYYFSSNKNKTKFKANPSKYVPQYGGWCAYAMGKDGSKVAVNPKTFKILNGKLYLFYNAWGTNTLKYWNADEKNLKKAADRYWSKK